MATQKTSDQADFSNAEKTATKLLDTVIEEFLPKIEGGSYYGKKLVDVPAGKAILAPDRATQAAIVTMALDRLVELEKEIVAFRSKLEASEAYNPHQQPGWFRIFDPRWVLMETVRGLLRRELPLDEEDMIRLLKWLRSDAHFSLPHSYPLLAIFNAVEHWVKANEMSDPFRIVLETLIRLLRHETHDKECRKIADRLQALVSGPQVVLEAGEAWSDAARDDLRKMKTEARDSWNDLLLHCQAGGAKKFTPRWQKEAEPLIAATGFASFKDHALRWLPLVDKPRTQPFERQRRWEPDYENLIIPAHVEILRGLAWCCGLQEDAELARVLMRLAVSAYRKIPGKGPRLVSLGNACVTALGMMPGLPPISQLAVLKVKVKFGSAQKEIDKAFQAAAKREGLPPEEIEELAVPSYGLEEVGLLRESFGDYQAELVVDGSKAGLHWHKADKPIKSAPAGLKKDHAAELKELQTAVKDINTMLPAQRERLDTLFLLQKSWPLDVWRERYLDHPLVGTLARRLIWSFAARAKTSDGIWHDGQLHGRDGKPLNPPREATVSLWHPIGHDNEDILRWRDWLERREVVQPFKQAHREVYLLTDAERRTRTYSNRFAAHVLRQHQFAALCAARGWKNKLRLMVDDAYPPASRLLGGWNLRAEYWVEGAGSGYGTDTNETGTFLYLTTDQVRFYRLDAAQLYAHAGGGGYGRGWNQTEDEPLPLDAIPALVFSEIMRDVDLFVGVASVGNDPNWSDGGPEGRYRDYWQSYSFGELSATAQTRRALLERLIPRLKIADRCSLAERFLLVRGSLRTYKIHLGSGNILMLPNDQYLCIVPKQTATGQERVLLPFEGDTTLSVILSKAFLLAEDAKITDPTITNQLKA